MCQWIRLHIYIPFHIYIYIRKWGGADHSHPSIYKDIRIDNRLLSPYFLLLFTATSSLKILCLTRLVSQWMDFSFPLQLLAQTTPHPFWRTRCAHGLWSLQGGHSQRGRCHSYLLWHDRIHVRVSHRQKGVLSAYCHPSVPAQINISCLHSLSLSLT